jgi:alpha/beta superfamily hydrolase
MPWLVVQGEADELVDANVTKQWFDQLQAPQARYVSMPETSHFFHGKLIDLREAILAWAADVRRA